MFHHFQNNMYQVQQVDVAANTYKHHIVVVVFTAPLNSQFAAAGLPLRLDIVHVMIFPARWQDPKLVPMAT